MTHKHQVHFDPFDQHDRQIWVTVCERVDRGDVHFWRDEEFHKAGVWVTSPDTGKQYTCWVNLCIHQDDPQPAPPVPSQLKENADDLVALIHKAWETNTGEKTFEESYSSEGSSFTAVPDTTQTSGST